MELKRKMKNKILIEVVVPDIEESYNVFIPINKKVGNVALLISKAVQELTNSLYNENNANALYDSETGEILPPDKLVRDTAVKNGSKLILM